MTSDDLYPDTADVVIDALVRGGGTAFPADMPGGHRFSGMTLRGYFAAQAPTERVEFPSLEEAADFAGVSVPPAGDVTALARLSAAVQSKLAYIYADAMLSAREPQK